MQRERGKAKGSGKQTKAKKKKVVKRKKKVTEVNKGSGKKDDKPIAKKDLEEVIPPWSPTKWYDDSMYPGGYNQYVNHKRDRLRKKLDKLKEAKREIMGDEYVDHVEKEERKLQAQKNKIK